MTNFFNSGKKYIKITFQRNKNQKKRNRLGKRR